MRSKLIAMVGAAVMIPASLTAVSALADGSTSTTGGGNFIATGHDMDLHCRYGSSTECSYLKIAVDKVRDGSSLPILALDQGNELPAALHNAGYPSASVVTVNPTTSAFTTTAFVDSAGAPLYSAIITASDWTCGGCDNTPVGEAAINARAADFAAYFNAGGGILAQSAAANTLLYYNFMPLHVTGAYTTAPYTVTTAGAALGITSSMANCCATHNSFASVPAGMQALETDRDGVAETLAAFNASISTPTDGGGGGFTPAAPADTTAPSLALARPAADGSAGWDITKPVTVTVAAADSGSGLASSPACTIDSTPATLTAGSAAGTWTFTVADDGSHAIVCNVSDNAGNKAAVASDTVNIDTVAPSLAVTHTADGANGWNVTSPVTETVAASDSGSGLDGAPACTVGGTAATLTVGAAGTWTFPVGTDGSHDVLCNVSDTAGNKAQVASDTVTVDTAAPSLAVSHTVDGANGWNVTSPVTATVTAVDSGSGLAAAPQCIVDATAATLTAGAAGTWTFPVSGEGSHAISCDVSDNAGNAAQTASDTVKTDIAGPTVTVTGVSDGAAYLVNGVPVPGCTTTDATSGVATSATASTTGGPVGSVTATCAGATDEAGNATTVKATYTVNYNTGSGFLAPVNNAPTVNMGKAGRTYPIKFQLKDANGVYISSLSAIKSISYKSESCAAFSSDNTDALETAATGSTSLRYDSTANQFVYNWATASKGCYAAFATLASGQVMPAYFSLS